MQVSLFWIPPPPPPPRRGDMHPWEIVICVLFDVSIADETK